MLICFLSFHFNDPSEFFSINKKNNFIGYVYHWKVYKNVSNVSIYKANNSSSFIIVYIENPSLTCKIQIIFKIFN